MGGLAGHMFHLYDNPSLTFGEIKDIFQKAAAGELEGAEKTDGQNLYISYSVRSAKAKAARNKSNIKDGGLTPEELAKKYEGRGDLQSAFVDAFRAFELAAGNMPLEQQIDIFGPDANIFYNAEVQDPRTTNVIKYGAKTLTIHREGHAEFDKSTGTVIDRDLSREYQKLTSALKNVENILNKTDYKVITKAVTKLKALDNKKPLTDAINQISRLQKSLNIKDSDSIAQYLINVFNIQIEKLFPNLSPETKKEILKRLMKSEGATVNTIVKTIPKQYQAEIVPQIKIFIKEESELYKTAIAPLENIVHEFAVEMLKTLQSAFVLDNKAEIQRLRQELAKTIAIIEASSDEKAIDMVKRQFAKIKNIENISTAAEGFVFSYNGETYKFTGNFAPLNQILGILKYSRTGNKQIEEQGTKRRSEEAVVIWGRFNPPTIGHAAHFTAAKNIADRHGADLLIFPTRTVDNEKNPLKPEEKIQYLKLMFPEFANNIIDNPEIKTMFNMAHYVNKAGYGTIKIVGGEDRLEDLSLLKKYNNPKPEQVKPGADFYFDDIQALESGKRTAGISGTDMREAAINGDLNKFMKGIAGSLDINQAKTLLNLIRTRIAQKGSKRGQKSFLSPIDENLFQEFIVKSGDKWCLKSKKKSKEGKRKNLGCYPSRDGAIKREKQVQYFKHVKEDELEEMSGAAAITGYAAPFRKNNEDMAGWYRTPFSGGAIAPGNSGGTKDVAKRDTDITDSSLNRTDELNNNAGHDIKDNQYMIDRAEFVEELKLRKLVREAIKINEKRKKQQILNEEKQLRHIIRSILREGEEDAPHASTGINVLAELLKKIIPVIEKDFKSLTTEQSQRKSFRAHIINAVKNSLAPERAMDSSDESADVGVNLKEQDLAVKMDTEEQQPPPDSKFIDIGRKSVADEEEKDTFSLPGEDPTGRNIALKCFDKIEKNIVDSYSILSNKKDQDLFYDYLITNLKLYFDRFETELNPGASEPESNTYELEKEKTAAQPPETAADSIAGTAPSTEVPPEQSAMPPTT